MLGSHLHWALCGCLQRGGYRIPQGAGYSVTEVQGSPTLAVCQTLPRKKNTLEPRPGRDLRQGSQGCQTVHPLEDCCLAILTLVTYQVSMQTLSNGTFSGGVLGELPVVVTSWTLRKHRKLTASSLEPASTFQTCRLVTRAKDYVSWSGHSGQWKAWEQVPK